MSLQFAGPYEAAMTLAPAQQAGKILSLAFSPLVDYAATGDDHNLVTIWSTITGDVLCQRQTAEPVTSILWHPSWRSVLFIGCGDGDAFGWNFRVAILELVLPIELIDFLAKGPADSCLIWSQRSYTCSFIQLCLRSLSSDRIVRGARRTSTAVPNW